MQVSAIVKDIVLLGGGHAHAVVIRKWGMKPISGVRLTLISRDALTPYSGMLPGLLAGHYTVKDTHIDLIRLCRWANVRFVEAEITGISANRNSVSLEDRPDVEYDVLSVDTGSTPNNHRIPSLFEHAVPVKPVHLFYCNWLKLQIRMDELNRPLKIGVVGAGAGGFELLMAIHTRLQSVSSIHKHQYHWIVRGDDILSGHSKRAQLLALSACKSKNIQIHRNFLVSHITEKNLKSTTGKTLHLDETIWCTDAIGADWLKSTRIQLDQKGFIAVNSHLQSNSHKNIFAAGDVATQVDNPVPKAGVYAVRAGPVLFENLKRYILKKSLKTFRPQTRFLSLLATGEKSAIASKGKWGFKGSWVWLWKNYIDSTFMHKFNVLPARNLMQIKPIPRVLLVDESETFDQNEMRCGGCGAKISSNVLNKALHKLPIHKREDQVLGLEHRDDTAIIDSGSSFLSQSVDQIKGMIDDPYTFARIAANHALSDLHAMGAAPQSAMTLVSIPHSSTVIQTRDLNQLMQGTVRSLNESKCTLSGGHTSEALETSLGFVVNGLIQPDKAILKSGMLPGDRLILTKAIGTGVLLAGDMQALSEGPDIQACIKSMLQSNQIASKVLIQHSVTAMTDVTGFGLLGHLAEMLVASNLSCTISSESIPILNGVKELNKKGIQSTLLENNKLSSNILQSPDRWVKLEIYNILFDPQTSGGLLASVPDENANECVELLQRSGYHKAVIIGSIVENIQGNHPSVSFD